MSRIRKGTRGTVVEDHPRVPIGSRVTVVREDRDGNVCLYCREKDVTAWMKRSAVVLEGEEPQWTVDS